MRHSEWGNLPALQVMRSALDGSGQVREPAEAAMEARTIEIDLKEPPCQGQQRRQGRWKRGAAAFPTTTLQKGPPSTLGGRLRGHRGLVGAIRGAAPRGRWRQALLLIAWVTATWFTGDLRLGHSGKGRQGAVEGCVERHDESICHRLHNTLPIPWHLARLGRSIGVASGTGTAGTKAMGYQATPDGQQNLASGSQGQEAGRQGSKPHAGLGELQDGGQEGMGGETPRAPRDLHHGQNVPARSATGTVKSQVRGGSCWSRSRTECSQRRPTVQGRRRAGGRDCRLGRHGRCMVFLRRSAGRVAPARVGPAAAAEGSSHSADAPGRPRGKDADSIAFDNDSSRSFGVTASPAEQGSQVCSSRRRDHRGYKQFGGSGAARPTKRNASENVLQRDLQRWRLTPTVQTDGTKGKEGRTAKKAAGARQEEAGRGGDSRGAPSTAAAPTLRVEASTADELCLRADTEEAHTDLLLGETECNTSNVPTGDIPICSWGRQTAIPNDIHEVKDISVDKKPEDPKIKNKKSAKDAQEARIRLARMGHISSIEAPTSQSSSHLSWSYGDIEEVRDAIHFCLDKLLPEKVYNRQYATGQPVSARLATLSDDTTVSPLANVYPWQQSSEQPVSARLATLNTTASPPEPTSHRSPSLEARSEEVDIEQFRANFTAVVQLMGLLDDVTEQPVSARMATLNTVDRGELQSCLKRLLVKDTPVKCPLPPTPLGPAGCRVPCETCGVNLCFDAAGHIDDDHVCLTCLQARQHISGQPISARMATLEDYTGQPASARLATLTTAAFSAVPPSDRRTTTTTPQPLDTSEPSDEDTTYFMQQPPGGNDEDEDMVHDIDNTMENEADATEIYRRLARGGSTGITGSRLESGWQLEGRRRRRTSSSSTDAIPPPRPLPWQISWGIIGQGRLQGDPRIVARLLREEEQAADNAPSALIPHTPLPRGQEFCPLCERRQCGCCGIHLEAFSYRCGARAGGRCWVGCQRCGRNSPCTACGAQTCRHCLHLIIGPHT